jgi:hypothetical protein
VADEMALLGAAHVDEDSAAGLDQRPGIARGNAARIRQGSGLGSLAGVGQDFGFIEN